MAGEFFWYDVMTTDVKAAQTFYGRVMGWSAQDSGAPGVPYTVFSAQGRSLAGLMEIPPEVRAAGEGPAWMGYVAVADLDAACARLARLGGTVHRPPTLVPEIIRFAVVSDTQGAGFILAQPLVADAPPPLPPGTPGTAGWRELYAADWRSAFDFYEQMFGWRRTEAIEMGPMGTYQMFAMADGAAAGGMMNRPEKAPRPAWVFYFNIEAINAAAARVSAAGGTVLNGPSQVPGGQWILQCRDPQGAFFCLVAPQA